MANDAPVALSYVVPAHNSTATIEGTLKELADRLAGKNAEVVVVENGSSDGTLELLRRIESEWDVKDLDLRVLTCKKGLGNALKTGIAQSRGARLFLGADDLPFGFGDLDAAEQIDHVRHPVVIGSKAHPKSEVNRGLARDVFTFGFLTLRRVVLGMRTGDPQGTFILDGAWARQAAPKLTEEGFLLTTELVYLAESSGIKTVEVPVKLRASHAAHGSRIKVKDVWNMGSGLLTVRRRHRKARAAAAANA